MIEKTRIAPAYYGVASDLRYRAHSGMSYDNKLPSYNDKETWLAWFDASMLLRSTLISGSLTTGTETISTGDGVGVEKPCLHRRIRRINVPYLYCIGHYSGSAVRYYAEYWRFPVLNGAIQLTAPAYDYQFAKQRAYWNMLPRFEGDISMLNFLFELKDFRDIANALPKAFQGLRRAWDDTVNVALRNKEFLLGAAIDRIPITRLRSTAYYRDIKRRNSYDVKRYLNKASSTQPSLLAAEAWLFNAFALQPLIKDISTMLSQATLAAADAQSKFKDLGDQVQTSHYSETEVLESSGTSGTNNNYWYTNGIHRSIKYTATCKYTYDYTMRQHFDAFMRYWGLSGSFEALWNATPWSFLVDYVLQVGKSIHAMERDPNVNWHVKSWLDTTKYLHSLGYYINGDPRAKVFVVDGKFLTVNQATGKLLSGVEGSIYDRKVSQPMVGIAPPRFRGPSLKQWLNVAALARCFF